MSAAGLGIRAPTQAAAGRASRYQRTDGSTAINKPADDIHMPWEVSIMQSIQLHQSTVVAPYDLRSIFRFFWMVPNLSLLRADFTSGKANLIPSNAKRCNHFAETKKK